METDNYHNLELPTISSNEHDGDQDKGKKTRRSRVGSRLREIFAGKEDVTPPPTPETPTRGIALADFLLTQQAENRRRDDEEDERVVRSTVEKDDDDDDEEDDDGAQPKPAFSPFIPMPRARPEEYSTTETDEEPGEAEPLIESAESVEPIIIAAPEAETHEIDLDSEEAVEVTLLASRYETNELATPITSEGVLMVDHHHEVTVPAATVEASSGEEPAEDASTSLESEPATVLPMAEAADGAQLPPTPPGGGETFVGTPEEPGEGDGPFAGAPAAAYRMDQQPLVQSVLAPEAIPRAFAVAANGGEAASDMAEQRGVRRGLAAGILVGGVIEHVRHTKRARREATTTGRQFKKQGEQLAQSERRHSELEQQMQRFRAENLHMQQTIERQTEQVAEQPQMLTIGNRQIPLQAVGERTAPSLAESANQAQPNVQQASGRVESGGAASEHYPVAPIAAAAAAEAVLGLGEQEPPAVVPETTRIETSSWHRIEVDKNTGKVVENPSIAYGEAFLGEQAKEMNKTSAQSSTPKQKSATDSDSAPASPPPISGSAMPSIGVNSSSDNSSGSSFEEKVSSLIQGVKGVNDSVAKRIEKLSPTPISNSSRGGDNQQVDTWLWVVLGVVVITIIFALVA